MIDNLYIDGVQVHVTPNYFITFQKGLTGSPVPRQEKYAKSRRHGITNKAKFYDGRVVELKGVVIGSTLADFQTRMDNLVGLLSLGSSHLITFLRSGAVEAEQFYAIVDTELDAQQDTPRVVQEWGVSLVADDPRIYGQTLNIATYDPTVASPGTGVKFPLTFPLVFGSSGTGLVVSNTGNFRTPPIITVTGPVSAPIIDNDTDGTHIYTTGLVLLSSDTLVIDVAQRSVTLNGVSRPDYFDSANSSWWEINKGTSTIRLRGSGMVTGQTSLKVQWRNARI